MERRLQERAGEPILLYDFLRLRLGLTKRQIRQLKFHRPGILVNGERQYVTYMLAPGDLVEVDVEGNASPKPLALNPAPVDILYEDEDLIAVNKPAGVPTHPGGIHQTDTLVNMLMYYFHGKGESLVVRPAGRLDRDTSGVILFSKNQTAAGRLVKQKERKQLRKTYLALAEGHFPEKSGRIDTPLRRDPGNACRVICAADGKPALTYYEVLEEIPGASLLRVRIETGRMHQIRVHMASAGHPLLGDPLYGSDAGAGNGLNRAALHAASMSCRQPFTGEALTWEAPLPEDMKNILNMGGAR